NTNILTNIGNTGTDFIAATGALTLAGVLTANGGISIGTQALTGTTGIIDYSNFDVDASGNVTGTKFNKITITAPATGATLTIADGKTLTASNTLTFTGTDSSSVAFGTGGTVAYTANKLSVFAATTSAALKGVISYETGVSGALVFADSQAFTTQISTPSIITASGALGITPAAGSNVNINLSTTGDFAVNTNQLYVDTSTGNVGIGTASPSDAPLVISATNTSGITAGITTQGSLLQSSSTTQQQLHNFGATASPQGASLTSLYGQIFLAHVSNSSTPITQYNGIYSRIDPEATYSGTIQTASMFRASSPNNGSGIPITNWRGLMVDIMDNGNGLTSGTVNNEGIFVGSATAASAAGGTINNYSTFINVPSGSPTGGTTLNYGLYITGNGGTNANGGTPTNYALYNSSTANNYFAGNVGIGDTTPAALFTVGNTDLFQVNSSGAIAATTGITSSGAIAANGGITFDQSTDTLSTFTMAGTLAMGTNNITSTGSLGATGARLTAGFFTDLTVTNAIA